jgi:hypothetical protein
MYHAFCVVYYLDQTLKYICICDTGRFIIYSGITKIYYRKTVGHVFMKPVQIEQQLKNFFPSKLFFIVVHISGARRCECM